MCSRTYLCVHHQILYVPVGVLLHAAGACGHPTAERRKLVRVGLVANGEPTGAHLPLKVLAHDARLEKKSYDLYVYFTPNDTYSRW